MNRLDFCSRVPIRGRVIPSKVNEESAVLGHVEELLQGVVGAENEFEPP